MSGNLKSGGSGRMLMNDATQKFNDTLKRLMDSKPKPQEDVKDEAKSKRESERRHKMGAIDPINRRYKS
jgi:hypothetical protein|tara:strand:- start:352 stop:558 length:207 start_codon:yes stop_codon:yes gene_type:complete